MNTKTINFSDVSSWFDLDKYKNTETYDVIDWVTQLDKRIWLYDIITEPHWDCFGDYGWATLFEIAPEILEFFGFAPEQEEYNRFDDVALPELGNALISSVNYLTLSDVVENYDAIKNKQYGYFVEQVRNEIDQFETDPETDRSEFELLYTSFDDQWVVDNDFHCGEIYLKINLQSPNSKIEDDLKRLLPLARNRFKCEQSPFFSENEKKDGLSPNLLNTMFILPLIDILIWETIENSELDYELRDRLVLNFDVGCKSYKRIQPWIFKSLDERYVKTMWDVHMKEAIAKRERHRLRQIKNSNS